MTTFARTTVAAAVAAALLTPAAFAEPIAEEEGVGIELVTLPVPESPLVAIRLMFRVGSIDDPEEKDGLAALTALMVGQGSTAQRSYKELLDALYPMAASIQVNSDREVTLLAAEIHREKLEDFTQLLLEVVREPAFTASDLERNREELIGYLTATLRAASDELLGLEAIQQVIFADHPYQHSPAGTVQGLRSIALEDVRSFYRQHYTRANLMLGIAGGYPEGYPERLRSSLGKLPAGEAAERELPAPPKVERRRFTLIEKETSSVGIHFGYPLPITRADPDYYALMVANSYLGEHRTFHGRLMEELRRERGLNYGDYSYIEYWENPPGTSHPSPNVPRRQQYFSVWIRPVVPENDHFALRAGIWVLQRLIEDGLTQEGFELARDFLINYSKLWAQTLSDRLGFHMDSRFYGMPYYIDEIESRLKALSREEVNRAVKKHLQTADFRGVMVTAGAADLKARLEKDEPSPISYENPVSDQVEEDDKAIQDLKVRPTAVEIVPVAQMFEN